MVIVGRSIRCSITVLRASGPSGAPSGDAGDKYLIKIHLGESLGGHFWVFWGNFWVSELPKTIFGDIRNLWVKLSRENMRV